MISPETPDARRREYARGFGWSRASVPGETKGGECEHEHRKGFPRSVAGSGNRRRRDGRRGLHAARRRAEGVGRRFRPGVPHLRRMVRPQDPDRSRRGAQGRRNDRRHGRSVPRDAPGQAARQDRPDSAGREDEHVFPYRLPVHERQAAHDGRVHVERPRRTREPQGPLLHREPRDLRPAARLDGPRSHQGHGRTRGEVRLRRRRRDARDRRPEGTLGLRDLRRRPSLDARERNAGSPLGRAARPR